MMFKLTLDPTASVVLRILDSGGYRVEVLRELEGQGVVGLVLTDCDDDARRCLAPEDAEKLAGMLRGAFERER